MYRVEVETGTGGRRGVRCDLGVRDCKYVCVVGRGGDLWVWWWLR